MWWKSEMNFSFFLSLAAFRMRSSACGMLVWLCAQGMVCWPAFPLVPALGSTGSAAVSSAADRSAAACSALSRPLQRLTFRGSIPHPMQLLCTLRNHCRQWPRNTRYQAGRYPLLGPVFHRLDRTSLRLAHSLDHLVGTQANDVGHLETERLRRLHVEYYLVFGRLLNRQVRRLLAFENPIDVTC